MNGWATTTLGDLFEIARGGSPRPIENFITESPQGVNWVSISDATDSSKFISATKRKILPSGVSRSRMVKPGDLLLTNSMSFGRPYIMNTTGCIHDGWLVLSSKHNDTDANYFFHLLGSQSLYAEFERLAAGVTVKNLNIDLVRGVQVSRPPLAEQQRIANILDAADALRAKRRAAIEEVDSLSQAIFIEMFGDPAGRSKGEGVVPLIDLIDSERPISYGILMPGPDQTEGVKYVRVVDMKDGGIELAGIRKTTRAISDSYKRSLLKSDDVLLSIRGHVGRAAIVPPELEDANITQDTARLAAARTIVPLFLREYLRTDFIQQWMERHTKGVAVQGINLGDVKKIPIALPPLPLQQEFARRIAAVEALKAAHRASLAELDALFASLQHRAFRGEL